MKASKLPKNKNKSVRINDEIMEIITAQGLTLQSFLDHCIDEFLGVEIIDKQAEEEQC